VVFNTDRINGIDETLNHAGCFGLMLPRIFPPGTRKDNTNTSRAFHEVLERKGYDMTYIEVAHGHDWSNWQPLLDDVLLTFFSKDSH